MYPLWKLYVLLQSREKSVSPIRVEYSKAYFVKVSCEQNFGVDKKSILRTRLTLEELLLTYVSIFGAEREFSIQLIRRFQRMRLEVAVMGEACDPFEIC